MELAKELGTGLVAMCSIGLTAAEAVNLANDLNVSVVAVDVDRKWSGLPAFTSTELLKERGYLRGSDTSIKRNLGLYLAQLAGWDRVLFLDDDIVGIDPVGARTAVGLLDKFNVVGLNNIGYPDNSVICHANRELGHKQDQFIGGGGLAVAPLRNPSFFPDIYNEDWLYILGTGVPLRVAVTGHMVQVEHRPFADPRRARSEELGDCLAEGLFWLLDQGQPIHRADEAHWYDFLARRGSFIGNLQAEIINGNLDSDFAKSILVSLDAAWGQWMEITPNLCAEFVRQWQIDLGLWRFFLRGQPTGLGLSEALEYVAWPGLLRSRIPWPAP